MKKQQYAIEVHRGQNGWLVKYSVSLLTNANYISNEFYVFETFDHLTKWLKEYYEKKLEE